MVDKVYRLAVRYTQAGATYQNDLHMAKRTVGDPTAAQFTTIANAWANQMASGQVNTCTWTDWIATQELGDGVTYSTSTCRQIGGAIYAGTCAGGIVGVAVTDPLPPMATVSVALHTALRGRSFRSRVQLGGFGEDAQSAGQWTAGHVSNRLTAVGNFFAAYGAGGTDPDWDWVVFSRGIASGCYPDPVARHHPLVHRQAGDLNNCTAIITSVTATRTVSTTRSRLV